jgi:presenilin-like A22 family membrane protease
MIKMKKRKEIVSVLLPVVITLCLYVVFYPRIASKPSDAGFWLILVLGMSIGIALTRLFQRPRIEK